MLNPRHTALLGTVALLLLTGCSDARSCTAVGATDLVRVDLRAVPFAGLKPPFVAELCVGGSCRPRQPIVGSQVFFAGSGDFLAQEPTRIEVKVYSAARLVREAATTVRPEEYAPNGRECGPVVSQAHVKFEANNTLRQAPADEK